MKSVLIVFCFSICMLGSRKALQAQTVTQNWATLNSTNTNPWCVATDASGNVFVANQANNTVSKITASGTATQAWATLASNASPYAITVDASGNVYVANYNNTVSKVTSSGTVTQAWATLANGAFPYAMVMDA